MVCWFRKRDSRDVTGTARQIFRLRFGAVNTGIALANPNDSQVRFHLLYGNSGTDFGNGSLTIPAHGRSLIF